VGPRAGLDAAEKKISFPCRESYPGRPAPSLSLYRLGYPSSLCLFHLEGATLLFSGVFQHIYIQIHFKVILDGVIKIYSNSIN
jgi:hypothetical protein